MAQSTCTAYVSGEVFASVVLCLRWCVRHRCSLLPTLSTLQRDKPLIYIWILLKHSFVAESFHRGSIGQMKQICDCHFIAGYELLSAQDVVVDAERGVEAGSCFSNSRLIWRAKTKLTVGSSFSELCSVTTEFGGLSRSNKALCP